MASQGDVAPPKPHPAVPTVTGADQPRPGSGDDMAHSGSASPSSDDDDHAIIESDPHYLENPALARPKLGSRKSSGTIIIPRDSPHVELRHEEYEEGDARTMSPRRSSEEIDRMGEEARKALIEYAVPSHNKRFLLANDVPSRQAKTLQASLLEICDRVESVRSEHEKLEGGNKFLQSCVIIVNHAVLLEY